jgi:large subunit ribosomal protein L30
VVRIVAKEALKTIYVKWVRSGIGFSHRQKRMIRSLGLMHLSQVVERSDTPQVRGLVAQLAHLVQIVDEPQRPKWASVPEYAIRPRVEAPPPQENTGVPRGAAAPPAPPSAAPPEAEQAHTAGVENAESEERD